MRCPRDDRVLVDPQALARGDGDPFLGLVVAGRFAVLEMLGAGSMGTVYRARQEGMARDVALKIVRADRFDDSQARGRFQQEAHAMSLLTSPHTVTVFDFGEIASTDLDELGELDGSLYLAMELLDGCSLGDRLDGGARLPVAEAVRIAQGALRSLAEAHDKGIIHRDLKPDNLMLVRSPTDGSEMCKVLDFGIAKVLWREHDNDALRTQAGTVFGTPRYMSPEQAQGRPLDPRSDLYSLGVILYHMLLGRAPYTEADAVVVMAHHIKTPPPPAREIAPDVHLPKGLERLLTRLLDKDPGARPQSATELIALLEPYANATDAGLELPSGAPTPGQVERLPPRLGAVVLVATAALAVVVLLLVALAPDAAPPEEPAPATRRETPAAAPAASPATPSEPATAPVAEPSATAKVTASASPPLPAPTPPPPSPRRRYERFE